MSDKKARLEALSEARTVVQQKVDSFGASPVFGFSKEKFFLGVAKSYTSIFILGRWPGEYWKWHAFQYWMFLPLNVYRWSCMKKLLYYAELCWMVNLGFGIWFAIRHFRPELLSPALDKALYRTMFAFANGPLAIAVPLFGNALVPHSIDHTLSLLIHLQPIMTSYTLTWHCGSSASLSLGPPVGFLEFFKPVLKCIAGYTVFHSTLFLTWGLRLGDAGHKSSPHDQLKAKCPTALSRLLGELGSGGSDTIRYLKYEAVMTFLNMLSTAVTYGLYRLNNQSAHFGVMLGVGASAMWNGAGWYAYNLRSLTKGLDKLMDAELKDDTNQ